MEAVGECIGGWYEGEVAPEVVVTGICQGGGSLQEKTCWLESGPSVETVCNLDAAARIAGSYSDCELHIWIVDQEYANIIADREKFTSRPDVELEVGAMLDAWCRSRYPTAKVRRTSEAESRSRLYGAMANGALAQLYPQGVPRPYGNQGRIFWQEVQYLISVAAFADPVVSEGRRTVAVADHEQLRALAAAKHVARDALAAFALWPCPRLGWRPPRMRAREDSTRYAERFLFAIKNERRRMYRAPGPHEILYVNLTKDQVVERCKAIDVSSTTVAEVCTFLTGKTPSAVEVAEAGSAVHSALAYARSKSTTQSRGAPGKGI
jgi:hypothetical protein